MGALLNRAVSSLLASSETKAKHIKYFQAQLESSSNTSLPNWSGFGFSNWVTSCNTRGVFSSEKQQTNKKRSVK